MHSKHFVAAAACCSFLLCVNVPMPSCGQALVTVAVVYNWIVIILRVAFEDMRENVSFKQSATGLYTGVFRQY